jgi:hypothetical protein
MVVVCVTGNVLSVLAVYPHQIAYFNELAGGPSSGAVHLANSNVDWGQSLIELKEWCYEQQLSEPLYCAYYGFVEPGDLGLQGTRPVRLASDGSLEAGWYVVSQNYIAGLDGSYYGGARRTSFDPAIRGRLQEMKQVTSLGYALQVFHVETSTPTSGGVGRGDEDR